MKQRFERDPIKANLNLQKRRVGFEKAQAVFDDPLFITLFDVAHSFDEERYITIGVSNRDRLLLVAQADREETIRIISAREATKNEQRYYKESPS